MHSCKQPTLVHKLWVAASEVVKGEVVGLEGVDAVEVVKLVAAAVIRPS